MAKHIGSDFTSFIGDLGRRLETLFRGQPANGTPGTVEEALGEGALSVFIPERFGGRGQHVDECLSMLETCSYESLPLSLVAGINGALFLQPVSKYADEEVQARTFDRFVNHGALGGLMITEPDFGTDALQMRTSFRPEGDGYRLRGTKHWGGLTGRADHWLLTAREETEGGSLGRNINFFVWDRELGGIEVDEYYHSLGLEMIPYGRNRIDTYLPEERRMTPLGSGVRMLLDVLHRSRLQFPGMGMGFLRRLLDEGVRHARGRIVGGRPLADYDQVQSRLAEMQAAYTTCSAMCAYTTGVAGVEKDCSPQALPANTIKSVVTDIMQSAAQSLLQLVGAAGYRRDHLAGSAVVDSRPFQIFEGSNDILYQQISEAVLKSMKRLKESNLSRFLGVFEPTKRVAGRMPRDLDFSVEAGLPQRKMVDLGRILGRIMSMQMVVDMKDRGYREDLAENCITMTIREIRSLAGSFAHGERTGAVEDYREGSAWSAFLPDNHAEA
jgi:alkylation response protein AidB-like acyl-CoA dehydrogenase